MALHSNSRREGSPEAAIKDIRIFYGEDWQAKLKRGLELQYARSPYFKEVSACLEPLWEHHELLREPLERTLDRVSTYLGFAPTWVRSSRLIEESPSLAALANQDLILGICKHLDATTYWNPQGGRKLYDPEKFSDNGIALEFIPPLAPDRNAFSIVDVLMDRSRAETVAYLDSAFRDPGGSYPPSTATP